MNKKFVWTVVFTALIFVFAIIAVYGNTFGAEISLSQADWGAFGDYFGGILNPVFAFAAFLGVLWSVDMQARQLKKLSIDKQGEEILIVVKDIDTRISELLKTSIDASESKELCINHMVSESERKADWLGSSDSYCQFIGIAKESGSVVEASVRELKNQVIAMHSFLDKYPKSQQGHYAPIVDYYIRKTRRIVPMLNEVSVFSDAVLDFFQCK